MITKEIAISLLNTYNLIAGAATLICISWLKSSSTEPWSWKYLLGGVFMLAVPTGSTIFSIGILMVMFSHQGDSASISLITMFGGLSTTLIGLIGGGIAVNAISTWINSHKPTTRVANN